jgi:hypothetical protein
MHPFDRLDMLRQHRIRFAGKGGGGYRFYTSVSRRVSKQSRIYAVPGDNPQGL